MDDDYETMRTRALCLSPFLREYEQVVPVSTLLLMGNLSELPIASIQHPVPFDPTSLQTFLNVSSNTPPFSASSLSLFNSFTTNDLANDFTGGILSLIVVAQLHRIFKGLIYFFPGVHNRGYSSYVVFSRLASFRYLFRLFTRREPFGERSQHREEEEFGYSLKTILFPLTALALLYIAELVTIIAGTTMRSQHFAEQNFDPKISVVRGAQRPRRVDNLWSDCDDFFVSTRGLFESGKVLKCVSEVRDQLTPYKANIKLSVRYYSGDTIFDIHSRNGSYKTIDLSTFLLSKGGVRFRTMPFRPDLSSEPELKHLLNGILNGVRRRLGYSELDTRHTLWAGKELEGASEVAEEIIFYHFHDWNDSAETIAAAFMAELRYMDLVLNSTGLPWVFTRPYTFEQMNPAIAVVKQYRIAHGWLLIALVLVILIQFVVNTRVTHFDEVAFLAMKELMGEDCVLGPLAADGVVGTEVDLREVGLG
ncbi:hypothetical protein BWQ96_10624 [Gracilariopsis chorda]|uniref:Uncharacterized protein n=1 Tax=Gracilariopsis chorda TaxID=448386 RepID=A0A2V3IC45_9FLOR|nr:hypothetical protein BWQ96_10624 [Gracilariopsis chorda]|eukprot:PXF39677.1 hypothetical protein BWQ96_10624 [Gracilariopsis chorda]